MMQLNIILERMRLEKKIFVTSDELEKYCIDFRLEYANTLRYFLKMKYLIRIFRGIYYAKILEEYTDIDNSIRNHLELASVGLGLKGVKNWYFGLYTALKLNNMTHEFFTVDDVISDTIFRANSIKIAGCKFKFTKTIPSLFNFGIKESDRIRFSDPEKTILDFIYIMRYGGYTSKQIVMQLSEWAENISNEKILAYSKKYPNSIAKIVPEVLSS